MRAFNGSGHSAANAHFDDVQANHYEDDAAAITVPGALDAWAVAWGLWAAALEIAVRGAIAYARDGFPVYERVADWAAARDDLAG